jgi:glycosyltransferase involved in cell wall biosynthesis
MRVLHVIPSVAPRYGGPSFAVLRYGRALRARGVGVTIATTNADGEGVLPVPLEDPTEYEGVDARFFERRGESFKYSPSMARWLRRWVTEFDVVHVHAVFSHSSLSAGRACRAARVPYIVRPLGSLDPWSLAQSAWRKRVLLWSAAGSLLRYAAGIHFTTEAEQQLAGPVTGRTPSKVVPLGIDDEYLRATFVPAVDRDRRIAVLARLDRKKNLVALIRAFHAAAATNDWRLTIAGDGDLEYTSELHRAAEAGDARARIQVRPWVDGKEKIEFLRRAAAFAVPSHQENFGLAALEALGCGVPVIVARSVNLAPAIDEAGAGWLTGTTEEELEQTLTELMRDELGRHRKAMKARSVAARFTWNHAAAELDAWYAELAPQMAVGERR